MEVSQYQHMFANENTHWWFVAKRFYVTAFLSEIKFIKKTQILDLGCGTGAMTKMLGNFGQALGVEQNTQAITLLKKRKIRHLKSSINSLPFASSSFDIITIFDVLYHQKVNENLVLAETRRLLKRNSYLLVTDCALPFFWSSHDEAMMAKKRFQKKELENLLIAHGFEIIRSTYLYFMTFPFFVLQRMVLKMLRPRKIKTVDKVNPILNWMLLLLVKIDLFFLKKNINLLIGSSVMILARRK